VKIEILQIATNLKRRHPRSAQRGKGCGARGVVDFSTVTRNEASEEEKKSRDKVHERRMQARYSTAYKNFVACLKIKPFGRELNSLRILLALVDGLKLALRSTLVIAMKFFSCRIRAYFSLTKPPKS
jgi:hypothetical protein